MNRNKLLLVAFIPAMAMLGLSSCQRAADQSIAQGQGQVSSDPTTIEQSETLPAVPPALSSEDVASPAPSLAYAEVTRIEAVTKAQKIMATVTATRQLLHETTAPHEVCADVVVEERKPERDGNVGGTVAGALIGGVIGNQVGGGDGRKLATVAGAVAGGYVGHKIDKNKENGEIVSRTEKQCHTEQQTTSTVTGYQVTFRKPDGSTDSKRMDSQPAVGSRIEIGSRQQTVGYNVTYNYDGKQSTVRMDHRPGEQLPVIDGQVVLDSQPVSQG